MKESVERTGTGVGTNFEASGGRKIFPTRPEFQTESPVFGSVIETTVMGKIQAKKKGVKKYEFKTPLQSVPLGRPARSAQVWWPSWPSPLAWLCLNVEGLRAILACAPGAGRKWRSIHLKIGY